ncbi:tRNA uridine-5-carboxymethylaminomethyl(34) synthesis GTPase MnmE [Dichotomicrobium thermohalophilum]|uniref:tRNA modification GTPase MnmE n=1 Tax=Dichotomicrobium thermohalophilum TaxID=933063 RepID=A0A397Q1B2_9HYPH|nr:tRNA modification GTPase [Dichotomicrobium thermohalophilum]
MNMQTTIYALSSAPGRAGVAVIRVSGPATGEALCALAGDVPPRRRASLRDLRHPGTGRRLDRALVLWFPAPSSFTGEDVAELHVHGGRAVIEAVLSALAEVPGMRAAQPGEFARRAFENGKLDLTAVEGLADLIDAETEAQRLQALRQSDGALAALYESWRQKIILALAEIEADLDFSDEADVLAFNDRAAFAQIADLERSIRAHLDDSHRGEILRDGLRVAIAGPVNAGKSSLLNALARREAAIVSEKPGTTRDVVEVRLDLKGYPVIVSDTAGMRQTDEEIEAEGVRRALARAKEAQIVVWLIDGAQAQPTPPPAEIPVEKRLTVVNKTELLTTRDPYPVKADLFISVHTQEGIGELVDRIGAEAAARLEAGDAAPPTRERHRRELEEAMRSLGAFLEGSPDELELRCEDLRRAADCMGRLTGRIDVEDILDQIFAQFCIGK